MNKQVYREAKESFYQRPLRCESQYDLDEFAKRWPTAVLQSITNLRLRLEEIRPEEMQEYLMSTTSSLAVQPRRHPYLCEVERITSTLSNLPSVTHLQLLRPKTSQKSLPSSIVTTQVLNWVAEHYSRLQCLKLEIDQCHLDCLGSLTQLKSLCLTGFSETSPARTADVLSKLTNLEVLTVIGPPQGLQMLHRHGRQTKIVQSVNHQLFERMRPLRRLTLAQITDEQTDSSVFFTSKTMKALYEIHGQSLRALDISSSTVPSAAFVEYLSAFLLNTTNVQELRLTWPEMETTFIDCIPNSIRRLEFAVASRGDAMAIVDRLQMMRYRLQYLQHISFRIINTAQDALSGHREDKSTHLTFGMPIQNLMA